MPMKQGKATVGFGAMLKAHATDETDYGQDFSKLPGGITGGVAQLVDAHVGVYKSGNNVGKKFLYLAGAVLEPKTATEITKVWEASSNGKGGAVRTVSAREVDIEGRWTALTLPLCETKMSQDENVAKALNELRKLGGPECTAQLDSEEALESLCATLKEEAPKFRFGTSLSDPTEEYPNSRVWENWYGSKGLEDYQAPNGSQVQDNSPQVSDTEPNVEVPANEDTPDVEALLAAAKKKDADAQQKLTELAVAAGNDESEVSALDTWDEVAALINPTTEEEPAADDQPEPFVPVKNNVYLYRPLDPKTKKRVSKAVQCNCEAVDKKTETVTLKNLVNTKLVYKGVKWDELTVIE